MAIDRRELVCYEYICALRDIARYTGLGIYGLDNRRAELHNEICRLFGLEKSKTKQYTDYINLDNSNPAQDLYFSLLNEGT